MLAVLLAGASLYFFYRLANSAWGRGMVAVRDAEVAARSIGLNPVIIKTAAFALSAAFTGLAGAIFAPLFMFVAPDSFPFSQSILFLLAVIVGGAGWVLGPVVGRGDQRGRPGTAVGAGRVPPAVFRRPAAGGAVARAGGRARHAGALRCAGPTRAPPRPAISISRHSCSVRRARCRSKSAASASPSAASRPRPTSASPPSPAASPA